MLHELPQKKLDLLLRLPIVSGLVKKKILATLGLDQCVMAISGAAPIPPALLRWYGRVGRPYDGVECRIAPASGEILVKSAATMTGYYQQPELTPQVFTNASW